MKETKGKESKPIPVWLDRVLRERIEAVSQRMGESRSTVMRMAMRLGLETLEAAMEIKPSILNQLIKEYRQGEIPIEKDSNPVSYGRQQPQHVEMNEPKKKKAT